MSAPAGDERARLLRALALSRRFHLFLAYVESPRAADQLVRALGAELPGLRRAPVELVRLDPYEGREEDTPLADGELADRVLIPLLSPAEERKAHGVVHVVDASRAAAADTDGWARLFALWNEKRNALQQLGGEVLVVLPEPLKRPFATAAPDVWSIRSGEYTVREEEAAAPEASKIKPAASAAVVAKAARVNVARGSPPATGWEALSWYRAIPPLALFGGDLLVRPWLWDLVPDVDVEGLTEEAPTFRGAHAPEEGALAQRELRSAEHALGQRRFGEAAHMLRRVLQDGGADPGPAVRQRATAALLVALSAEDRVEVKEALAMREATNIPERASGGWRDQLLQAEAYAHWCAGHLGAAASVDARRSDDDDPSDEQSRLLSMVERGEITEEQDPPEDWDDWIVLADQAFLTGALAQAHRLLGSPFAGTMDPDWSGDRVATALRSDVLTAIVDLARGNRSRAARLLTQRHPDMKRTREPETAARVSAFHAYASGLLQAGGLNPTGAATWFTRARSHIVAWSRTGLDRRSLHRASLAVDLAHVTIDPAPADPVGIARQLVQRAVALLGDTAEDFVARVLAVEAHRELARRLAGDRDERASAEAHRALDLARPLAGRGVPAWDAILAATEREALTPSAR